MDRLSCLVIPTVFHHLPKLNKFSFDISECHFSKILNNVHHPLYDRIIFNQDRLSARLKYFFRPARMSFSEKAKQFFQLLNDESKPLIYIRIYNSF